MPSWLGTDFSVLVNFTRRPACPQRHLLVFHYSTPNRGVEYCDDCVCLFVSLSVHQRISGIPHPISTKFLCMLSMSVSVPLVLWRWWLGGRKGIRPVKTKWWGAGVVVCLEQGADLHMAQLMPLPLSVSCFSKIQIGFAFLVPAHLGSPWKRAVKRVCVCNQYVVKAMVKLGMNEWTL